MRTTHCPDLLRQAHLNQLPIFLMIARLLSINIIRKFLSTSKRGPLQVMLRLPNAILRPCVARMSTNALGLRTSSCSGWPCHEGIGVPLAARAWLGTSRPSLSRTFTKTMTRWSSATPIGPTAKKNASPSSQHEGPSASDGVGAPTLPPPNKFGECP